MQHHEIDEVYRGPSRLAETTQQAAEEQSLAELSPEELSAALLAPVGDRLDQGWAAHHKLNTIRTAMSLSDFTASWVPGSDA